MKKKTKEMLKSLSVDYLSGELSRVRKENKVLRDMDSFMCLNLKAHNKRLGEEYKAEKDKVYALLLIIAVLLIYNLFIYSRI